MQHKLQMQKEHNINTATPVIYNPEYFSCIATSVWANDRGIGVRFSADTLFSTPHLHLICSYLMGDLPPVAKRPEYEANHSPQSSVRIIPRGGCVLFNDLFSMKTV